MFGPVVGNFRSSRREFLYEQCSLHITRNMIPELGEIRLLAPEGINRMNCSIDVNIWTRRSVKIPSRRASARRPTVTYTTRGGKTIEASMIKPGVPVHVYYDTPGSTTVSRVVVDQD
jgi:hypothetical protein